jgi:hypothetical protein
VVVVGHSPAANEEDPLSAVWSPDFRRCPQYRRSRVAHLLKVSEDERCSCRQMTGDVLNEDEARLKGANELCDMRPQMALVRDSLSGSCM